MRRELSLSIPRGPPLSCLRSPPHPRAHMSTLLRHGLALLFVAVPWGNLMAQSWEILGSAPPGHEAAVLAVAEDGRLLLGGYALDTSNIFQPIRPRVALSRDGGVSFRAIEGPIGSTPLSSLVEAAAWRGDEIFVAAGDQLFRTRDEGATWRQETVGAKVGAIAFLDDATGVMVGEGGYLARTEDGGDTWASVVSGTSVNLHGLTFLDALHGWAWGEDVTRTTGDRESPATTTVGAGVLLRTTDGGLRWSVVHTFEGQHVGPLFARSPNTLWLATARRSSPTGNKTEAGLFVSTDAGQTLEEVGLPAELGRVRGPFSDQALTPSLIRAMFWDSGEVGRLAVAVHLGDQQSGSSGGSTTVQRNTSSYRIVDLQTFDGGKAWVYRNLGSLQVGLTGVSGRDDGEVQRGTFWHHYDGVLFNAAGEVFALVEPCEDSSYCLSSYACNQGACVPRPGTSPGRAEAGEDEGAGGTARPRRPGGAEGDTTSSGKGGCAAVQGRGAEWPQLVLVFLMALLGTGRQRRRQG